MDKSVQIVNPGTTQDNSIVLYDYAFRDPPFSLERVVVHELAHILYLNMNDDDENDYHKDMGWKKKNGSVRKGPFINSKAKDNPQEDFANNIESFLFESDTLKSSVPLAHKWISKKFSKNFKLEEKCQNEK